MLKSLVEKVNILAKKEIEKYGLPTMLHYDLSYVKAEEIATELNADLDIVRIGTALMDIKLGQCFSEGRLAEHVKDSRAFAFEIFNEFPLSSEILDKIINCIDAHHGKVAFNCIEAEICANADCYRFIHPKGVWSYHSTLVKRLNDLQQELSQVEAKLDEKYAILSLPYCKTELDNYYTFFKKTILESR